MEHVLLKILAVTGRRGIDARATVDIKERVAFWQKWVLPVVAFHSSAHETMEMIHATELEQMSDPWTIVRSRRADLSEEWYQTASGLLQVYQCMPVSEEFCYFGQTASGGHLRRWKR